MTLLPGCLPPAFTLPRHVSPSPCLHLLPSEHRKANVSRLSSLRKGQDDEKQATAVGAQLKAPGETVLCKVRKNWGTVVPGKVGHILNRGSKMLPH